jgi:hypothetical protein
MSISAWRERPHRPEGSKSEERNRGFKTMARLFSFASWNIEQFVGNQTRFDRVVTLLNSVGPPGAANASDDSPPRCWTSGISPQAQWRALALPLRLKVTPAPTTRQAAVSWCQCSPAPPSSRHPGKHRLSEDAQGFTRECRLGHTRGRGCGRLRRPASSLGQAAVTELLQAKVNRLVCAETYSPSAR